MLNGLPGPKDIKDIKAAAEAIKFVKTFLNSKQAEKVKQIKQIVDQSLAAHQRIQDEMAAASDALDTTVDDLQRTGLVHTREKSEFKIENMLILFRSAQGELNGIIKNVATTLVGWAEGKKKPSIVRLQFIAWVVDQCRGMAILSTGEIKLKRMEALLSVLMKVREQESFQTRGLQKGVHFSEQLNESIRRLKEAIRIENQLILSASATRSFERLKDLTHSTADVLSTFILGSFGQKGLTACPNYSLTIPSGMVPTALVGSLQQIIGFTNPSQHLYNNNRNMIEKQNSLIQKLGGNNFIKPALGFTNEKLRVQLDKFESDRKEEEQIEERLEEKKATQVIREEKQTAVNTDISKTYLDNLKLAVLGADGNIHLYRDQSGKICKYDKKRVSAGELTCLQDDMYPSGFNPNFYQDPELKASFSESIASLTPDVLKSNVVITEEKRIREEQAEKNQAVRDDKWKLFIKTLELTHSLKQSEKIAYDFQIYAQQFGDVTLYRLLQDMIKATLKLDEEVWKNLSQVIEICLEITETQIQKAGGAQLREAVVQGSMSGSASLGASEEVRKAIQDAAEIRMAIILAQTRTLKALESGDISCKDATIRMFSVFNDYSSKLQQIGTIHGANFDKLSEKIRKSRETAIERARVLDIAVITPDRPTMSTKHTPSSIPPRDQSTPTSSTDTNTSSLGPENKQESTSSSGISSAGTQATSPTYPSLVTTTSSTYQILQPTLIAISPTSTTSLPSSQQTTTLETTKELEKLKEKVTQLERERNSTETKHKEEIKKAVTLAVQREAQKPKIPSELLPEFKTLYATIDASPKAPFDTKTDRLNQKYYYKGPTQPVVYYHDKKWTVDMTKYNSITGGNLTITEKNKIDGHLTTILKDDNEQGGKLRVNYIGNKETTIEDIYQLLLWEIDGLGTLARTLKDKGTTGWNNSDVNSERASRLMICEEMLDRFAAIAHDPNSQLTYNQLEYLRHVLFEHLKYQKTRTGNVFTPAANTQFNGQVDQLMRRMVLEVNRAQYLIRIKEGDVRDSKGRHHKIETQNMLNELNNMVKEKIAKYKGLNGKKEIEEKKEIKEMEMLLFTTQKDEKLPITAHDATAKLKVREKKSNTQITQEQDMLDILVADLNELKKFEKIELHQDKKTDSKGIQSTQTRELIQPLNNYFDDSNRKSVNLFELESVRSQRDALYTEMKKFIFSGEFKHPLINQLQMLEEQIQEFHTRTNLVINEILSLKKSDNTAYQKVEKLQVLQQDFEKVREEINEKLFNVERSIKVSNDHIIELTRAELTQSIDSLHLTLNKQLLKALDLENVQSVKSSVNLLPSSSTSDSKENKLLNATIGGSLQPLVSSTMIRTAESPQQVATSSSGADRKNVNSTTSDSGATLFNRTSRTTTVVDSSYLEEKTKIVKIIILDYLYNDRLLEGKILLTKLTKAWEAIKKKSTPKNYEETIDDQANTLLQGGYVNNLVDARKAAVLLGIYNTLDENKNIESIKEYIKLASQDLINKFSMDESKNGYTKSGVWKKHPPKSYCPVLLAACNIFKQPFQKIDNNNIFRDYGNEAVSLEMDTRGKLKSQDEHARKMLPVLLNNR